MVLMAQIVCDRCGRDLDSLTDVGTVSVGTMGSDLYGYYVFCPECMDIIRMRFKVFRETAIVKVDK